MTFLTIAADVTVQISIAPVEIIYGLWRKGIVNVLNDLTKDEGIAKTIKAAIPILALSGDRYKPFNRSLELTLKTIYGVLVFKEYSQNFVDKDTRLEFLREHPVSTIIFMLGSAVQLPYYLFYDIQVVKAPIFFGRISRFMGGLPVLNHNPFISWIGRPRDPFTCVGSFVHLIELIYAISKKCKAIRGEGDSPEARAISRREKIVAEIFSPKNLLKVTSDIGKMGLCLLGYYYGKRWYTAMNIITQLASVLGQAIK